MLKFVYGVDETMDVLLSLLVVLPPFTVHFSCLPRETQAGIHNPQGHLESERVGGRERRGTWVKGKRQVDMYMQIK